MTHPHDLHQGFQLLALCIRTGAVRLILKVFELNDDAS
jgi:hypothetical protein